jgi:hypothetical protein
MTSSYRVEVEVFSRMVARKNVVFPKMMCSSPDARLGAAAGRDRT